VNRLAISAALVLVSACSQSHMSGTKWIGQNYPTATITVQRPDLGNDSFDWYRFDLPDGRWCTWIDTRAFDNGRVRDPVCHAEPSKPGTVATPSETVKVSDGVVRWEWSDLEPVTTIR
jgi:hypothetical protein